MAKLYNLARMTTATTGTGTLTLGSAVSGFLSFAAAGVQDGETVTYAIQDGSSSEIGRGVYTASGTTLTRTVLKSTNSDAAIDLSGAAQVIITPAAEDLLPFTGVPGGRLTLTSGAPVMAATQAATGTLYYTPYLHDCIWLYVGGAWQLRTFAELSIALSGGTASKPHDVFAYDNAGAVALELLAWTDDTNRTVGLARADGRLVKSDDTTRLYLGSVYVDGSKQAQWTYGAAAAGGTAAQFDVWNMYNRVDVATMVRDTTDTWTYATAAWRAANASTTMRATYVCGVNDSPIDATYNKFASQSGSINAMVGIGIDSATAFSGTTGGVLSNVTGSVGAVAKYQGNPGVGRRFVQAIEYASGSTATYYGDAGVAYFQTGLLFMGKF